MTATAVRPARPADGPALRAIRRAAIVEPVPELLELALGGSAGGPRCPVAVAADGGPVGYALALDDDVTCYVAELAVAAGHRRRGHATALVEALAGATDAGEMRLTVRAGDEVARAFYAARGFEPVGRTDRDRFEDATAGLVLAREP